MTFIQRSWAQYGVHSFLLIILPVCVAAMVGVGISIAVQLYIFAALAGISKGREAIGYITPLYFYETAAISLLAPIPATLLFVFFWVLLFGADKNAIDMRNDALWNYYKLVLVALFGLYLALRYPVFRNLFGHPAARDRINGNMNLNHKSCLFLVILLPLLYSVTYEWKFGTFTPFVSDYSMREYATCLLFFMIYALMQACRKIKED